MISLLTKVLPWVKGFFDKSSSDSGRAAELEAERKLVEEKAEAEQKIIEARAFSKGHISPRYAFQYFSIGVLGIVVLWIIAHAAAPAYIASPWDALERFMGFFTTIHDVIFLSGG